MTNGELVSHWLASALSNERGFSVLNRPQVAQHVALNADAVPNAQALPKEEVTASLTLNQVNAIDEKAQNFEGDGELVLGWKDERLCFNATKWANASRPNACCAPTVAKEDCACVTLRGEDLCAAPSRPSHPRHSL